MKAQAALKPALRVGAIVRHTKRPAWGPGRILQLDADSALVFFAEGGSHNGLARNPARLMLAAGLLEPAGIDSHPRLDFLPPLVGDSVTDGEPYVPVEAAIERFLHLFPDGFRGTAYDTSERHNKWCAHRDAVRLLAKVDLARLLKQRDYDGVVKRALKVIRRVNLLFPQEQTTLREGLAAPEHRQQFASALFELLHGSGPYEARFNAFADVLCGLPQKHATALKWPLQTILPFLYDPSRHMFLKPQVARQAARRCAFDLQYQPHPNWLTYCRLLVLCRLLYRELASLGPRDYIDLQSFIWCIADDK